MITQMKQNTNTEKLWTELRERLKGVQRQTVKSISEKALKEIIARAPKSEGEPFSEYEANMSIKQLGTKMVFSIMHERGTATVTDAKTEVIFIVAIENPKNDVERLYDRLAAYAPFTVDTWPPKVKRRSKYLISRRVSEREIRETRERLERQRDEIIALLAEFDIRVSARSFGRIKEIKAMDDIGFLIVRKEFGFGEEPKPHWRPGFRASRSLDNLKRILNQSDVVRAFLDPNYQGYENLGMIEDKITKRDLEHTKGFQKRIIGG